VKSGHVSVSVGFAVHHPGRAVDDLLAEADEHMYNAKRATGKMRVMSSEAKVSV
jgi:PleD family two-component response regulator